MKRETWTPINPDGSLDEAELRRPAETAEPTTWEVHMGTGLGPDVDEAIYRATSRAGTVRMVFGVDIERRCRVIMARVFGDYEMSAHHMGENIILVAGPIRTQADADFMFPELLAVKASRREAVFAPREAIEIGRYLPKAEYDSLACYERNGRHGGCVDCPWRAGRRWPEECPNFDRYDHRLAKAWVDAVRVRGGATPMLPAHVRALQEQATAAGVPFSLAWGEWAPLREVPHSPALAHVEMNCPFGPEGGVFAKLGPARSGCTLNGTDYPEET